MTISAPQPFPEKYEPTREDVLIGRVVDGEASAQDWSALEILSASDPAVWERLGRAQKIHARLERGLEDAIAIAELVDLPSSYAQGGRAGGRFAYAGWAAAAAIALAWGGISGGLVPLTSFRSMGPQGQQAGIGVTSQTAIDQLPPEAIYDHYVRSGLASGRVVGEMPAMFVDARELDGGAGKEVWYVRQILERTKVTDLTPLSVQMDEHGTQRFVPVPFEPRSRPATQRTRGGTY